MRSSMSTDPESSSNPLRWRGLLLAAITRFLSDRDPQTLSAIRAAMEHEIDAAGADALVQLGERLAKSGTDWGYNPPDPLARRIHHVLANWTLKPESALVGLEHGVTVAGKPVVLVANHLSYSDANVLEVMLYRNRLELAERLTVVAGPKVYSNPKRRFSSLCFGTIKTPQPPTRASENAVMPLRDLVRAARQSIDMAHERLAAGEALVIFGEGTRSRTRGLQQMMKGVDRYLDPDGTWVMPVGIVGSDEMYPIGDDTLYPVRIVVSLGRPVDAGLLRERSSGDGRVMMDAVGLAIANLLPPEYRGAYADAADLGEARAVHADVWS
jgi:1-acyl-sn-glycerol-3-phosphate acyltransferase